MKVDVTNSIVTETMVSGCLFESLPLASTVLHDRVLAPLPISVEVCLVLAPAAEEHGIANHINVNSPGTPSAAERVIQDLHHTVAIGDDRNGLQIDLWILDQQGLEYGVEWWRSRDDVFGWSSLVRIRISVYSRTTSIKLAHEL